MKKILIFLFVLIIPLYSFSEEKKEIYWYSFEQLDKYKDQLKPFDLVILSKTSKLKQIFGHIFLISEDKKLIEITGFDFSYSDSPIYVNFHIKNREVSILRYKKMSKELEEIIKKELPKYYNSTYNIWASSNDNATVYCSQFVYKLFKDATKQLGEEVQLVKPTWPIFPL